MCRPESLLLLCILVLGRGNVCHYIDGEEQDFVLYVNQPPSWSTKVVVKQDGGRIKLNGNVPIFIFKQLVINLFILVCCSRPEMQFPIEVVGFIFLALVNANLKLQKYVVAEYYAK